MKNAEKLVVLTVQDFMKQMSMTSIVPVIRTNINEYPYITFINDKNESENIYFSKDSAKSLEKGMPIVKGFFSNYSIGFTTNANGETRTKLVGQGQRLSVEDLF